MNDLWTTDQLNTTTQIARALEARDAARHELNEYLRQQRAANLLFGWALVAFAALLLITPAVCWWLLLE
jgi:hypothetical protein